MPPHASEKQNYCNFCYSCYKACKCKSSIYSEMTIEQLEREVQRLIRVLEARQQRERILNRFRNIGLRIVDVLECIGDFSVRYERFFILANLVLHLLNLISLSIFFFLWTHTDSKESFFEDQLQSRMIWLFMTVIFCIYLIYLAFIKRRSE